MYGTAAYFQQVRNSFGVGQQLFFPPTVAGWAGGQSWITPGLLLERGIRPWIADPRGIQPRRN